MTAEADVPDHIEALADLLANHAFEIEQSCFIVSDMLREAMERRLADRLEGTETLH
jgi:chemotaxis response regulator CheB